MVSDTIDTSQNGSKRSGLTARYVGSTALAFTVRLQTTETGTDYFSGSFPIPRPRERSTRQTQFHFRGGCPRPARRRRRENIDALDAFVTPPGPE